MRTKPFVGATLLAMLLIPQGGWPISSASSTEPAQLLPPDAACRGLPATVVGTNSDDLLTGTPGDDAIVVRAGGGDDYVSGTPGDDEFYGGAGRDKVIDVSDGDIVRGFEVVRG